MQEQVIARKRDGNLARGWGCVDSVFFFCKAGENGENFHTFYEEQIARLLRKNVATAWGKNEGINLETASFRHNVYIISLCPCMW